MKSVKTSFVLAAEEPICNEIRNFIRIVDFIYIILDESFGKGRAASIPDHASLVDSWEEQRKCVMLDIVRQMTVCLIASSSHQQGSQSDELLPRTRSSSRSSDAAETALAYRCLRCSWLIGPEDRLGLSRHPSSLARVAHVASLQCVNNTTACRGRYI
jgi:hypothetical protein